MVEYIPIQVVQNPAHAFILCYLWKIQREYYIYKITSSKICDWLKITRKICDWLKLTRKFCE